MFKESYPDEYRILESIGYVKTNGYGEVTIKITKGNITLIEPKVSIKIR
jgi:hypothetical protein